VASLELKVPPDVVALVVAALMWLASVLIPSFGGVSIGYRVLVAAVLVLLVVLLLATAKTALVRAGTTLDHRHPDNASHLVTTGVYRFTRNPIYLATLLVLLAWAGLLWNPVSACVSAAYVLYMNRFQIRPEERMLRSLFGQDYAEYARRVRRWL
jgi:protein-S-isoprenylcysteine O-methyltransferase Ste14